MTDVFFLLMNFIGLVFGAWLVMDDSRSWRTVGIILVAINFTAIFLTGLNFILGAPNG